MNREPAKVIASDRWLFGSAAIGALVWATLAVAFFAGHIKLNLIEVLFLLAPLVIAPLGLQLARLLTPTSNQLLPERGARLLQPFAAVFAAASFWLAPGQRAAALVSIWLLFCGLVALAGLQRLLRGAFGAAHQLCVAVSFGYLVIGGGWLVLSRLGETPVHFAEPIVLLTGVHFHFTGFALPLITGAVASTIELRSSVARIVFRCIVAGILTAPGILATGYVFSSEALKLFAVLFLSVSCVGLASFLFSALPFTRSIVAKVLIGISACSLTGAMILAAIFGVSQYTQCYWLLIPQMARWHGTANAIGFCLCGLLGWSLRFRTEGGRG